MAEASDPLSALIAMARLALAAAGLVKCEASPGNVYWSGGKGQQTIVLVHGANDQAGTWAAVVPALAKNAKLIVPDLAGHGESEPKTGPITLPVMVAKLHEVLEKEKAAKVTLVGNSMGAWVAILYALEHPDRVERLALESGGGLALPPGVPLFASNREEAVRIMHAVHGPDYAIADWQIDALLARKTDSPMARVMAGNVFPHFVDARLKDLKVPATIVWGEHDGVVLRSYVDKLQAGIAGSRLCVVPGAAHIPHAQQPERFIQCLQATS